MQQQEERSAFQLIQLKSEAGIPYPPVLLKLSTSSTTSASSSSYSASASQLPASQASPTVSLICSATRFVNGRQQLVEFQMGQEKVLDAGRKGLQSPRSTIDEILDEMLSKLRRRSYFTKYEHERSEITIILYELPELPLSFDFSSAESVRATSAFVLAFEAAAAFAEIVTTSEKSAVEAADALKARDRDLRISERKLQNTQQELSDKNAQYTRLLATGSLGGDNGLSPGKNNGNRRAASIAPMEMDDGSPRKKRKAAAPTLTGAGRIVRKKVKTGFIDSDDADSDSGQDEDEEEEPSKKSKSHQAEQAGSNSKDQEEEEETAQTGKVKHKTVKADPTIAKSGRTAQKQVEKGFVDDDSATDED